MRVISLDAAHWKSADDFYTDFFNAVGAPKWHGRNFNALRDSIITGKINEIEIPYVIQISSIQKTPEDVRNFLKGFCSLIKDFHSEGYDVDVVCDP